MVLDIGLPSLDGFDVLDQLRSQGSTMPVIVLTARDSVTDTVSALEGGADDYMAKPFRFAELLARVHLRLRQRTENGDGARRRPRVRRRAPRRTHATGDRRARRRSTCRPASSVSPRS